MKKLLPATLLISLLINMALIYIFVFRGSTTTSKDERTTINISDQNRTFVLAEMRGFLESVQGISDGIAANDPNEIRLAAEKAGGAAVHEAPAGLMKTLPLGFKSLGLDTHSKFDQIVKLARENYKKEQIQKQLSSVLSNCTSCHRTYKFEISE